MSKKDAIVTPNPKFAPTLGEGTITPAVLSAWENACFLYFHDRDIGDDKKVMKAAAQINNEVVADWYHTDYERFDNMSWDEFSAAIRARFLPKGWALSIYSDLFGAKQSSSEKFNDFVLTVERLNSHLRNTTYRQSEANLRGILIANMCEDLRTAIGDPTTMAIVDYVDWKAAVANADTQYIRNTELIATLIASRSSTGARTSTAPKPFRNPSSSASQTSANSLPKLTQAEKQLLSEHQGCFKCRRFYAGHLSGGCPNGFPKADGYVPLSLTMATKARDARGTKDIVKPRTAGATGVEDLQDEAPPDSFVAAVGAPGSPLATTMSGILGSGSDSEEYVSPLFS